MKKILQIIPPLFGSFRLFSVKAYKWISLLFWASVVILLIQFMRIDWKGSFKLISRDSSTGKVEIGVISAEQIGTEPIIRPKSTSATDTLHSISTYYSVDGSMTIDYSRQIWDLSFIKVEVGIGMQQSDKHVPTLRTGFTIRF